MAIDIAAALAGLKTAADLIGTLRKAVKDRNLKPEEVSATVLEIHDLVSDARSGLIEAQEEIARLNGEIRSLKEQLVALRDLKENYVFKENMYWRRDSNDGPFCPQCLDADGKLVRLQCYPSEYWCLVHCIVFRTEAQERQRRLR